MEVYWLNNNRSITTVEINHEEFSQILESFKLNKQDNIIFYNL